jgi:hypothetical protein
MKDLHAKRAYRNLIELKMQFSAVPGSNANT